MRAIRSVRSILVAPSASVAPSSAIRVASSASVSWLKSIMSMLSPSASSTPCFRSCERPVRLVSCAVMSPPSWTVIEALSSTVTFAISIVLSAPTALRWIRPLIPETLSSKPEIAVRRISPPSDALMFRSELVLPPLRSIVVSDDRSNKEPAPSAVNSRSRLKPFVPDHDVTVVVNVAPPLPRKPLRAIRLERSRFPPPRFNCDRSSATSFASFANVIPAVNALNDRSVRNVTPAPRLRVFTAPGVVSS